MIYANDISQSALQAIRNRCERENIHNIKTVLGEVADPLFPENDLEMVIMISAFHDFTKKAEWLQNVKKYMKKDAKLVIIDGHDSHTGFNKETVTKLGEDAGFSLIQYETFLSSSFIYVFQMD
jgi:ubiquinone/menaquinone biosynthesis C-methylase UbiE